MNDTTPKQSHSAYQASIAGYIGQLEYIVKHHADGEQVTWAHVGLLSELKEKLADLIVFLEGNE